MRHRLVWEPCPDCGRSSARPGGCFVVERRSLFGWSPALVTYDRGGRKQAEHYRSEKSAINALEAALNHKHERTVVRNIG